MDSDIEFIEKQAAAALKDFYYENGVPNGFNAAKFVVRWLDDRGLINTSLFGPHPDNEDPPPFPEYAVLRINPQDTGTAMKLTEWFDDRPEGELAAQYSRSNGCWSIDAQYRSGVLIAVADGDHKMEHLEGAVFTEITREQYEADNLT